MDIAICISGTFRQVKKAFPSYYENLWKPLNKHHHVDVFIHAWNSQIQHFKINIADDSTLEEVLKLYKPADYKYPVYDQNMRNELYKFSRMNEFQQWAAVQPPIERNFGRWNKHGICKICNKNGAFGGKCRICGGENVHNQIGMLYGIKECYHMATDYCDYDMIIRTRFDNIYLEPFKVVSPEQRTIYIPEGDDDFEDYGGGCNDQFAYGDDRSMGCYSSMFTYMNYFATKNFSTPGSYGIPHKLINNIAEKDGCRIVRFPFKYALQKRLDGK